MTSDRINTGAKVFLKSLSTAEEGREWRLIRSVVAYTGWLILFFVCGVCLISPEVRVRGPLDSWVAIVLPGVSCCAGGDLADQGRVL